MAITKKDYLIGALVGVLTGVFAIPTLFNIGLRQPVVFALLPFLIAALWAFGVWLGGFLSKWLPFFAQFGKYATVGFFNTAIDFGVLNVLSILSGVTAGFVIGGVNVPGFSLAVFNSYLWNKSWVFKSGQKGNFFHNLPLFILVNLIGLLLNSGLIILLTTYNSGFRGLAPGTWLNIAKVIATAISFLWNFIGFKFIVFRAKKTEEVIEEEAEIAPAQ